MIEVNKIYNEDCAETMRRIPDGSIDLILQDPPYNTTNCVWEYALDFEMLWEQWLRVGKKNCAFVFTASQPFTTGLINSKLKLFRYEWIWNKINPSGFLNAYKMPLKQHENIIVFYRGQPTYNIQHIDRRQHEIRRLGNKQNWKFYGKVRELKHDRVYSQKGAEKKIHNEEKWNEEKKVASSIISFPGGNGWTKTKNIHPTQKPVDLFRYLILTYTNPGETVFDGYAGSGTTAIACYDEGRDFICSEINLEYASAAIKRFNNHKSQIKLFTQEVKKIE